MGRTSFGRPLDGNVALGHDIDGKVIKGNWRTYPELAAAGVWTTPADLSKVLITLYNGYSHRSPALLGASTVRAAIQPQGPSPYGLGFETSGKGETLRVGHGGATEGYEAQYWLYPKTGDGAVVMTNGARGWSLILEVLRSMSSIYGWPDFKPDHRPRIALSPAALRSLAGTFRPAGASGGDALIVSVEGDHLLMSAPFGVWHMLPASAHEFFDTDSGISADFDQDGRQISMGGMTLVRGP
jgi:hypothetical protein